MRFHQQISGLVRLSGMLAISAITPPVSAAAEADWYDGRWPHEHHDLPPHPDAVFGRLGNGLRYVILPHSKPAGRVHLTLDVQAGSLMEADGESGTAHYLEHMAFNGSRHFPAGALVPFLQSHGMRFGGDANAHTSPMETVYELDLARTAPDDLDQGLLVLRDIAGDLSLDPEEVDKERGVILAEKSARDTEKSRLSQHRRDLMFAGTKFVNDTIGREETIGAIDGAGLRRFYDAWYRPEQMVVVAVGDADPALLRHLIESRFADMPGRGEPPAVEDWGDVHLRGTIARHDKTATSGLALSATALHPRDRRPDTPETQRRQLLGMAAREMMQRRLEAARNRDRLFVGAVYGSQTVFSLFPSVALSVTCTGGREEECIGALATELGSALAFGFSDEEFAAAVAFLRNRFGASLAQSSRRQSKDIAHEIVSALNADQVFQSEEQVRTTLMPMLDHMDKSEAEEVFRADWNSGNRIISSSGDADLGPAPEATVIRLWEKAERHPIPPQALKAEPRFPYLPEPTHPLAVIEDTRRTLSGSALIERRVELSNGMVLRLLPTPFDPGHLSLSLIFGTGLNALSDRDYDIALTTSRILRGSGLGALDRDSVRRLLGARQIKIEEAYSGDAFSILADGATMDQDLLLSAVWTQASDPQPRETERLRLLESLRIGRHDRLNSVDGRMPATIQRFVYGGALRSPELEENAAATVGLDDAASFLDRIRHEGTRTLVVVGDFNPDVLIARAVRLFADIPARVPPRPAVTRPQPVFPAGQSLREDVDGTTDEAVMVLAWRADTEDEPDPRRLAARRLLAAVFKDRLRERVREEMGASYSPSASYHYDPAFGGFGYYMVTIKTVGRLVDRVRSAAAEIAWSLSTAPVSIDAIDRVRATMTANSDSARQQNRYWQRLLEQETARQRPVIEWTAQQMAALKDVGEADLTAAAVPLAEAPAQIVIASKPAKAIEQ